MTVFIVTNLKALYNIYFPSSYKIPYDFSQYTLETLPVVLLNLGFHS